MEAKMTFKRAFMVIEASGKFKNITRWSRSSIKAEYTCNGKIMIGVFDVVDLAVELNNPNSEIHQELR